ncbi:hypothetical protein ACVWYN_001294 [Pedobacter sp. UYP24]
MLENNPKKVLWLEPFEMTAELMQRLEDKKLIIRLSPGSHDLEVPEGETKCKVLYTPLDGYGPHKIMSVTVNRIGFQEFGTHPDNEDFYMIGGGPLTKPLYLVIALCLKDELNEKVKKNQVSAADFVALKVKYNDPQVSFFTMLKNVPHGESIGAGIGKPASFYVTESRDMTDVDTAMGDYELMIKE